MKPLLLAKESKRSWLNTPFSRNCSSLANCFSTKSSVRLMPFFSKKSRVENLPISESVEKFTRNSSSKVWLGNL